jgi:hypothetical protein
MKEGTEEASGITEVKDLNAKMETSFYRCVIGFILFYYGTTFSC